MSITTHLSENQLKYLVTDNLDPDIPDSLFVEIAEEAKKGMDKEQTKDEIYSYFSKKIKEETGEADIVRAWNSYKVLHDHF